MSKYQLVIFDCDGVLVDSERLTNTVFAEMLNELGIPVTLEDMFDQFVGNSTATCLTLVEERLNGPVPDGFVEDYKLRCKATLEHDLKPIRGIRAVLENLSIPYCVASSGDHEKIRMTLGITKLLPFFEGKIFSVVDVGRPKPNPDVFLYAAKEMGFKPSDAVVIEDTPIGVKAGVAAGMTVIGYSELMSAKRLLAAGASACISDMNQLHSQLKTIAQPLCTPN